MGNKKASGEKMSEEDIVRMASKVAAEAAIEAFRNEQKLAFKNASDRRLHNTELLLRNYRAFKDASENAVFRAEDCESLDNIIMDLMMQRTDSVTVHSIKRSAARTAVIVKHIERMLELYKNYCFTNGKPEDARRWRVIDGQYIQERKQSIAELAKQEFVTERQIYDDRSNAISKIAVYMFGIDCIAHQ